MFETATLTYGSSSKRTFATLAGFSGQALLVACAFLAPMVSPQSLPRVAWITTLAPPLPPLPPPPLGPRVAPTRSPGLKASSPHVFTEPPAVPTHTAVIVDEAPATDPAPTGVPGGVRSGREGGVFGAPAIDFIDAAPRPHPPAPPVVAVIPHTPPPPPTVPQRITSVRMATPIRKVEPLYPSLARAARVSGTVELLGVLGVDGRIHELKVLHGHPLLVRAAMDAVAQWIFEPTLLNGQPVEVSAPITVNFILK